MAAEGGLSPLSFHAREEKLLSRLAPCAWRPEGSQAVGGSREGNLRWDRGFCVMVGGGGCRGVERHRWVASSGERLVGSPHW